MFDPSLYVRTLRNASGDSPDFYLALGDYFSIERLIENNQASADNVERVYAKQRNFLVNCNHEQAALLRR